MCNINQSIGSCGERKWPKLHRMVAVICQINTCHDKIGDGRKNLQNGQRQSLAFNDKANHQCQNFSHKTQHCRQAVIFKLFVGVGDFAPGMQQAIVVESDDKPSKAEYRCEQSGQKYGRDSRLLYLLRKFVWNIYYLLLCFFIINLYVIFITFYAIVYFTVEYNLENRIICTNENLKFV